MMRPLACALVLALVAVPAAAQARRDVMGGPRRPPAFLEQLFRPEMVMENQAEIGLTAEQRDTITRAIKEAQERLVPLQWEVEAKSEAAAKAFAGPRVDLDAAMALVAPVMALEEKIKTEHLQLLIQIKNALTPEQQEKLRALRAERGPGRR